jgi:hypothetical protein
MSIHPHSLGMLQPTNSKYRDLGKLAYLTEEMKRLELSFSHLCCGLVCFPCSFCWLTPRYHRYQAYAIELHYELAKPLAPATLDLPAHALHFPSTPANTLMMPMAQPMPECSPVNPLATSSTLAQEIKLDVPQGTPFDSPITSPPTSQGLVTSGGGAVATLSRLSRNFFSVFSDPPPALPNQVISVRYEPTLAAPGGLGGLPLVTSLAGSMVSITPLPPTSIDSISTYHTGISKSRYSINKESTQMIHSRRPSSVNPTSYSIHSKE